MYFVEEKGAFGKWVPVVYCGEKPQTKTTSGKVRTFRNDPVEVPECLRGEDLLIIKSFLSPDGEFVTVPTDEIAAIMDQVR